MDDEVWTTADGRKINVGDMKEEHVRNALRMILRKRREQMDKIAARRETFSMFPADDEWDGQGGGWDNRAELSRLREKYGDDVRVERASVASMDGGNVYGGNEKIGWFGGI